MTAISADPTTVPDSNASPQNTAQDAQREVSNSPSGSQEVARRGSGQVPIGDVRLTANIRQDIHLKLKITAAERRTTIGQLIEELVEKHL